DCDRGLAVGLERELHRRLIAGLYERAPVGLCPGLLGHGRAGAWRGLVLGDRWRGGLGLLRVGTVLDHLHRRDADRGLARGLGLGRLAVGGVPILVLGLTGRAVGSGASDRKG